MKEKIIAYIEDLENKARESDRFFRERNEVIIQLDKYKAVVKEINDYLDTNSLYEQDYDYDYEENLVEGPVSDVQAKEELRQILKKVEENRNEI